MSTVSSTPAINPYLVPYSTNDLSGTDTTAGKYTTSSSSSKSSGSSSGSYSQGLIGQMTGLDVTNMVNESMQSDVVKLNSLLAKQQISQWQQDRYRSVITNLQNFSSKYFDVLSDNYMLSSDKYSVYTASSDKPSIATASTSNDAKAGTYTITSVPTAENSTGLAAAAKITNSNTIATQNSAKFSTLGISGTLNFNINGKDVSYDLNSTANNTKTVSQVMNDLSDLTGATFSYSELSGKFSITSSSTGSNQVLNIYNENAASTPSNATGTTNIKYSSTDTSTNPFLSQLFGVNSSSVNSTGKDGQFTIMEPDGTTNTVTEASNHFTIDGVTYDVTNAGSATISVSKDVSSAIDKIKNFVTDYNNLIDGINTVITEKRDYDYKPLSATQESDMNVSQITAWNQNAQKGLLENDGTLTDILSSMREAFYTPVEGNGLTMAGVGLSTSDDVTQGGKITLDVTKLKTALQNNPQQVVDLFTKASSSYTSYYDAINVDTKVDSDAVNKAVAKRSSEEGILQRISDLIDKYAGTDLDSNGNQGILLMKAGMPDTITETKSTLYKELKDEAQAVKDFKAKMTSDVTMYNKKFTNLQSILSELSSQQSALSSMLGTGSSS